MTRSMKEKVNGGQLISNVLMRELKKRWCVTEIVYNLDVLKSKKESSTLNVRKDNKRRGCKVM